MPPTMEQGAVSVPKPVFSAVKSSSPKREAHACRPAAAQSSAPPSNKARAKPRGGMTANATSFLKDSHFYISTRANT